jgi:peptidyl-prolyl cis-trans isomerase C
MILKNARLLVALASCAALPAYAQNIAVVNGAPVPTARATVLEEQISKQGQAITPEIKQQIREELVNRELLEQEAVRRGIANRADVKQQLALAQQSVLVRALLDDLGHSKPPTDAELQARYAELVKKIGGQELHLHHILVDNEQQAKDLIAKIKGGASFEALAKQYSKDPGSGKQGGDLDWSTPQVYVPEFADAASKLKKGEITPTPVKTQFGWHVIRLDDTRPVKVPPFEQVKAQVAQQMQQEQVGEQQDKLQALEAQLRKNAKIQ